MRISSSWEAQNLLHTRSTWHIGTYYIDDSLATPCMFLSIIFGADHFYVPICIVHSSRTRQPKRHTTRHVSSHYLDQMAAQCLPKWLVTCQICFYGSRRKLGNHDNGTLPRRKPEALRNISAKPPEAQSTRLMNGEGLTLESG